MHNLLHQWAAVFRSCPREELAVLPLVVALWVVGTLAAAGVGG